MIEILHRYTRAVLYRSETAASVAAAVKAARDSGANLRGANLSGANLSDANLRGANLRGANLSDANPYGANLSDANLSGADLSGANLYGANLYGANLRGANLSAANLYGANLYGADLSGADLSGADLSGANLSGANLYGADLSGANLSGANLSGANLSDANLSDANLSDANLYGADLYGARGVASLVTSALPLLRYQAGPMRALKLVNAEGHGPTYRAPRPYVVGESYEEPDANTDEAEQCAAGINVASPDWIWREWQPGQRVLAVEFLPADIAAIPVGSDGKFRLHRCKVVEELPLHAVGLPRDEFQAAQVVADVLREVFGA